MFGGDLMGISIKTNFATNSEIATMFGTIDTMQRYKVGDRVVTAGSTPILKRAKELAPRDTSGHGKKRSDKQKDGTTKAGDKIRWDIPLHTTIKRKVVRGDRGAWAIIGPSWPDGNKAYFNTGKSGNKGHHWGYQGVKYPRKDGGTHIGGTPRQRVQIRNWIVQAADETRGEQLDAMKSKLQEAMDEVMRG